jgi:hypothetical protein
VQRYPMIERRFDAAVPETDCVGIISPARVRRARRYRKAGSVCGIHRLF